MIFHAYHTGIENRGATIRQAMKGYSAMPFLSFEGWEQGADGVREWEGQTIEQGEVVGKGGGVREKLHNSWKPGW